MEEGIELKLIKEIPMIKKGRFFFETYSSDVYWYDEKGGWSHYPLRAGLAGYLWLLRHEKGYFRKVIEVN